MYAHRSHLYKQLPEISWISEYEMGEPIKLNSKLQTCDEYSPTLGRWAHFDFLNIRGLLGGQKHRIENGLFGRKEHVLRGAKVQFSELIETNSYTYFECKTDSNKSIQMYFQPTKLENLSFTVTF